LALFVIAERSPCGLISAPLRDWRGGQRSMRRGVGCMAGRGGAARGVGRAVGKAIPLVAVLVLVGAGCSKSSSSSSELTTIFVQKFRYHGMPTTMKSGVHEFLFENRESLSITHE